MSEIKELKVFEIEGKQFRTLEEAKKYKALMKNEKILKLAEKNDTVKLLEEMITQGITNKGRILNLIKYLERNIL